MTAVGGTGGGEVMSDDALKLSAFLDRVDGALRLLSALGDTDAVAVRAGPGSSLYAVL